MYLCSCRDVTCVVISWLRVVFCLICAVHLYVHVCIQIIWTNVQPSCSYALCEVLEPDMEPPAANSIAGENARGPGFFYNLASQAWVLEVFSGNVLDFARHVCCLLVQFCVLS